MHSIFLTIVPNEARLYGLRVFDDVYPLLIFFIEVIPIISLISKFIIVGFLSVFLKSLRALLLHSSRLVTVLPQHPSPLGHFLANLTTITSLVLLFSNPLAIDETRPS
jgi:hypothetical protein